MSKRICELPDCGSHVWARNLCSKHYRRFLAHGDPLKTSRRENGEGTPHIDGYWAHVVDGRDILQHRLIAERALGKRLPEGAQVHHLDEDKANNDSRNLVVCPDAAYHRLLHVRQRAYDACGHADWLRCSICHTWSPPAEITLYRPSGNRWHPACWRIKHGKPRRAA